MRLIPSDPDLETVVGRIQDGSIDLQPDFQRGAVWSRTKQQLLIDSVLRNWYIPPVHLVRTTEDEQIVLDGQQRLRAIHEFVRGSFGVAGDADPPSEEVKALDGLRYDELPPQVRRRFDRFTIRVFEVVDYNTAEPYELFFRLNQPTPLTSAEKRNAFFGAPRDQVAELASVASLSGMTQERIGYSNARLAYEDVLARFVWTLELGTLAEKVTANRVTQRFRKEEAFEENIMALAHESVLAFFQLQSLGRKEIRLNRAMTYSWLCLAARGILAGESMDHLDSLVADVEILRNNLKRSADDHDAYLESANQVDRLAFLILNDRASARVNDVSSVLLRDCSLWALSCRWHGCIDDRAQRFVELLDNDSSLPVAEQRLLEVATESDWARLR